MKEEQVIQTAVEKAKDLIEELGFDAEISAQLVEGEENRMYINMEIKGEELGLLIGYQGRTLRSFEQVVGMMLSAVLRKAEMVADYRIIIDVNDYKKQREEHIKEMVLKAIDQVKETNQTLELPVMNPAERRIVHMIIKQEGGIASTSEGEEGNRRVTLSLAK